MFDKEYIINLKNGLTGQRTVIQQGESLTIEGSFADGDNVAIGLSSIASFTMTLYDENSATLINSRNAVDILNANNCTVTSGGAFTIRLTADDATIFNSNKAVGDLESHILKLVWTWSDGVVTNTGIAEYRIFVQKIASPA